MRPRFYLSCSFAWRRGWQIADDSFDHRIGIALVLGDFGGVAREVTVTHRGANFFQDAFAKHFDQPRFPLANATTRQQIVSVHVVLVITNRGCKLLNADRKSTRLNS